MAAQPAEAILHLVSAEEADSGRTLLEGIDIRSTREGGLIEAMVSVGLINREEVAVNEAHVAELRDSIQFEASKGGSTGQLSPVLLAHVPTKDKFVIIDGFHRDAALHTLGQENIFATIRPDTSEEEVLDLRILTANSHSSVSFARVVEWINDAWAKTAWADRLTATQAFTLTQVGTTGARLGLDADEAASVREWVRDKSDKWLMATTTIRSSLSVAELADPELVQQARGRSSGRKLNYITPAQLKIIAEGLPKRYAEQNMVAELSKKFNYTTNHTRAATQLLSKAETIEEAMEIVTATDWTALQPVQSRKRGRELEQHEHVGEEARQAREDALSLKARRSFLMAELQLGVLSVQNLILRGDYVVPDQAQRSRLPGMTVELGEDVEVRSVIHTMDPEPRIDALLSRVETVQQGMVNQLMGQTTLTKRDAGALINLVAERLTHDMEVGALQYIGDVHSSVYDRLVANGVRNELSHQRDLEAALFGGRGRPPREHKVEVLEVLEAYTGLSEKMRRYLTLSAFMGLTNFAVGQVIHLDAESTKQLASKIRARFAIAGQTTVVPESS